MRVLVTLLGPDGGVLVDDERSTARAALAHLPHDHVYVLAADPEHPELEALADLADRAGARVTVEDVPAGDLVAAFDAVRAAVDAHEREGHEVHVQVNAGRAGTMLSAAGLLACLHAGTSAHFVHEEGHDELGVVTRAPLTPLLRQDARDELVAFPDDGLALDDLDDRDAAALNTLKDGGMIAREGDRLVLTPLGHAYQAHVRRRPPPG